MAKCKKATIFQDTLIRQNVLIMGKDGGRIADCYCGWRKQSESESNAKRLCDCYNACINLENPQQDIQQLKDILYTAESTLTWIKSCKVSENIKSEIAQTVGNIDDALSLFK